MSRQPQRTSRKRERDHVDRLYRLQQELETKRALIATWENQEEKDPEYIKELHRKVEKLQARVTYMAL